jgi:hypothetical protein
MEFIMDSFLISGFIAGMACTLYIEEGDTHGMASFDEETAQIERRILEDMADLVEVNHVVTAA